MQAHISHKSWVFKTNFINSIFFLCQVFWWLVLLPSQLVAWTWRQVKVPRIRECSRDTTRKVDSFWKWLGRHGCRYQQFIYIYIYIYIYLYLYIYYYILPPINLIWHAIQILQIILTDNAVRTWKRNTVDKKKPAPLITFYKNFWGTISGACFFPSILILG